MKLSPPIIEGLFAYKLGVIGFENSTSLVAKLKEKGNKGIQRILPTSNLIVYSMLLFGDFFFGKIMLFVIKTVCFLALDLYKSFSFFLYCYFFNKLYLQELLM